VRRGRAGEACPPTPRSRRRRDRPDRCCRRGPRRRGPRRYGSAVRTQARRRRAHGAGRTPWPAPGIAGNSRHFVATLSARKTTDDQPKRLVIEVVGTGVDPVTFRFSGTEISPGGAGSGVQTCTQYARSRSRMPPPLPHQRTDGRPLAGTSSTWPCRSTTGEQLGLLCIELGLGQQALLSRLPGVSEARRRRWSDSWPLAAEAQHSSNFLLTFALPTGVGAADTRARRHQMANA
jgi:hypothetical protein